MRNTLAGLNRVFGVGRNEDTLRTLSPFASSRTLVYVAVENRPAGTPSGRQANVASGSPVRRRGLEFLTGEGNSSCFRGRKNGAYSIERRKGLRGRRSGFPAQVELESLTDDRRSSAVPLG
jgi:hypothetical protein